MKKTKTIWLNEKLQFDKIQGSQRSNHESQYQVLFLNHANHYNSKKN